MKQTVAIVLVAVVGLSLVGCQTNYRSANGLDLYGLKMEPLKRSEYQVMDETEGSGSVTRILMLFTFGKGGELYNGHLNKHSPVSLFNTSTTDFFNPFVWIAGIFAPPDSAGAALYDALEKAEGADALLSPRVRTTYFCIPLLFSHSTSTVKAKAVQVKKG